MRVRLHPDNPSPRVVQQVVECLRDGGVIIYPTDSVYGLGCDMNQRAAIEKVARLKGVKPDKADFSLICYDLSHISDFTRPMENSVFKLMKRVLPGPFTFILNANNSVPKHFRSSKKTIGIRVPDNNIPRDIVKELGHPIITTSVKDDDEFIEYTTDPELIYERYKNQVDMVIDGGFGNNEASTVVDCTSGEPEVLRQGIGEL